MCGCPSHVCVVGTVMRGCGVVCSLIYQRKNRTRPCMKVLYVSRLYHVSIDNRSLIGTIPDLVEYVPVPVYELFYASALMTDHDGETIRIGNPYWRRFDGVCHKEPQPVPPRVMADFMRYASDDACVTVTDDVDADDFFTLKAESFVQRRRIDLDAVPTLSQWAKESAPYTGIVVDAHGRVVTSTMFDSEAGQVWRCDTGAPLIDLLLQGDVFHATHWGLARGVADTHALSGWHVPGHTRSQELTEW